MLSLAIDGAFCTMKENKHVYNVQLLGQMVPFLDSLDCKYFCLSHEQLFAQNKNDVMAIYHEIYSRRKNLEPGNFLINVDDYFVLEA